MPSPVYVGQRVQTPMIALTNNGEDKSPAIITALGASGPNGGVMVSLQVFHNSALTPVSYDSSVEFLDYEGDARGLANDGVGTGAWPLDYTAAD